MLTTPLKATKAPNITTLATIRLPRSMAIWLESSTTTRMSSRKSAVGSECGWLTIISPPGRTMGMYLSREGRLRAIRMSGRSVSGEPILLSATTTVQLAVPPRISGP